MSVPLITEAQIDAMGESLQPDDLEEALTAFSRSQPVIVAYLMSENFRILHEEEREYLLYLALVIWRAVEGVTPDRPAVAEKDFGSQEEYNWGLFDGGKGGKFRERMDAFFTDSSQEDLLAFVEDALYIDPQDSEDNSVTKEGRIPMAVALKTVIDLLTKE